MKNVTVRAISGAVYVAVLVGAVLAGGVPLLILTLLFALVATHEFLAMARGNEKPHRVCNTIDYIVNLSIVATCYFMTAPGGGPARLLFGLAAVALIVRMIAQLYAIGGNAIVALSTSIMSYLYIGAALSSIFFIYYVFGNAHLVLAILIFIWINDTGAFCVGSMIGKHRLFERISPKKSWEGFFGGMLFCVIGAIIMHFCFPQYYGDETTLGTMCRLGILVSIFATFGDLIESMIKRTAGVKDSGNIIPGHGGLLDRIDSLLLVMPAALIMLFLSL